MSDGVELITSTAQELGVAYEVLDDKTVAVALPGEQRLRTACVLTVGEHALHVEAFVMRRPDEHHEAVYRFLLQHNARMYAVHWSIDQAGDVYLVGRLPLAALTAEELDRVFGCVLEYADGSFNALLQLGFGSSIRREWAWRTKNGESLANLAAFADFAQRPED